MEGGDAVPAIKGLDALQLANDFNALGATYFALYLSLISGYLVVAFLAGAQLNRRQLRLVNAIFTLASLFFLFSTMSTWFAGLSFYLEAASQQWSAQLYITAAFNIVLSVAMLVGIFASVQFMRDVRQQEPDFDSGD